ncbi:type VI secretion system protein ImpL [Pseudomonas reinekei]|jgi:type VI secretion system protein ImpL|uniref:Type VI secretion system membrane subunit TssM n=1 Tax=Pseudomonas reinekei TaxID=395598 RepID=A0A1H0I316_PSERE|nr:type VI secretion system membrane subunit TssM [Pseudomonas reinekei]KAB0486903.1 type VI secretion system membrane subunit TssM [Pseudomonas reinekei]SDO25828.1 type VI secretion system protein ImpL [Pseudomonas reinekei]
MGNLNIWNAWSQIKGCSNWLGKSWLVSLAGVVSVSLLVWYEGPLLAFDGRQPLAPEAWRWRLIAALFVVWALYWGIAAWRVQRANRLLMQGVEGDENATQRRSEAKASEAEMALLGERMRGAMAVLRKASPGWKLSNRYLYQLPWYLFVGAPGSGKTTALTHSGLQFPLSDSHGPAAVGGVGGTRNCDWWFTDEAVLLDTAGRYTTQDSYTEVDRAAWFGFLDLLKKHRRRRPINGVIVALSVSDLLQHNEAQRQTQALAIRARIQELQERLGLNFPVYVVVTKCDLLAGFAEFFEPMGREERSQVWGVTFPPAQGGQVPLAGAALAGFPDRFDALEKQLHGRVLERMQQERDLTRRALLYSFAQQFAGIGEVLTRFLNTVFEPNRFQDPALLRGVYFTSGTQQGNPIDRVMSSLAAAFGLGRSSLPSGFASGRSYFITRLMREVIFQEAGLAGINPVQERRQRFWLRGAMALIGLMTLMLMIGLTVSYQRNAALVQASAQAVTDVARKARELPTQGNALVTLPLLNAARSLPAGFAHREDPVPLLNRLGVYQGEKLGTGAITLYRRLLRSTLLPRIVNNLESALRRGDASNQEFLYETLRVYLMLGERQYFDAQSVQAWVEVDWRRELPQATEDQRQQLSDHVQALFDAEDEGAEPVQLDAALVSKVRQTLAGMPLAERTYNRLKRQVAALRLPESSVSGAAGRDVSALLVRRSGVPLSQGVSGVFSVAGYREWVARSSTAVAEMAKDKWVLGREEKHSAADTVAMQQAVLGLYYAEYIRQWDALLADVQLVSLTGLDQAALVSSALSANDSPLRAFLQLASRETTLENALTGSTEAAGAQPVRDGFEAARKKLRSALDGNEAGAPLDTPYNPVDPHFAALHSLVNSPAPGPLDDVSALLKDAAQYFDSAEAARRSGSPAPSGEVLTRLKRAATTLPAPLSAVLRDVDSRGGALTLGNERERLNALWNSVGAPFCRAAIDGRYPLVRTANRDITADDFGKFFGPGGVMDDFFSKNLVPYVDMSSNPWRPRTAGSGSMSLSQDVIDQFQRAARLRDMFFVNGARQPSLRFDLKAVTADPGLNKVILDIDGQPVVYEAGVVANFTPIVLPSGKGGDRVNLHSEPASARPLDSDGPWAWLHLLDKGSVRGGQGERYQVEFNLDGRRVQYELRASSVINPFRRNALEQFRCPSRL